MEVRVPSGESGLQADLVAPAVSVLRNLIFKNTDDSVIRALVHGNGGKQMVAALEFLKALQEFDNEEDDGGARQAVPP